MAPTVALPGTGQDAGKTVIYRDTWGIPHIYAPTVAKGLYAQGYAQAQDRPEQLLINLKIVLGELSSMAGPDQVRQDLLSHMFDHMGNARRFLAQQSDAEKAALVAFTNGINRYYADHPEDLPAWWGARPVTPEMIEAFGRFFLYNWSIDEALGDLRRAGIEPGFAATARASNQWAVAPSKSASGNAMLVIDPHLSWWGPSRFWEMRIHAGELHGSGVALVGSPYIGLGHNEHIAWAMTTGGPDTADVYELTLNPDNANQYRYEGEWRDLRVKQVTLNVRGVGEQRHELAYSHHGPVLARADGKAYAGKIPYNEQTDRGTAWEKLNFAKDYRGAVAATETLAMFPQNVMVADTSGNIYYQRTGRVPRRNLDYDWSLPVDGSVAATEWQGVHPATDHLQLLNPAAGYMQNCNVPPDAMLINSPLQLQDHRSYLFSSKDHGPQLDGWSNQRAARILHLLSSADKVSTQDMLDFALDVQPYGVERWLAAFAAATPDPTPLEQALLDWDLQLERTSTGALKYAYWRDVLFQHAAGEEIRSAIDDHYALAAGRAPKAVALSAEQHSVLRQTYAQAMQQMQDELGSTQVPWGRVFRVARGEQSWPVGGGRGEEYGLTTLRTIGYEPPDENFVRKGYRGQTSTQVVELSQPISSWVYLPVGQSDDPESAHFADQAEQLLSERRLKPSWWLPEDLIGHVQSRVVLD
ncbi:MAG: penicillin acylase family protein [Pseudomonadales bacterium]